jgi:hypothetical protein
MGGNEVSALLLCLASSKGPKFSKAAEPSSCFPIGDVLGLTKLSIEACMLTFLAYNNSILRKKGKRVYRVRGTELPHRHERHSLMNQF